MFTAILKFIRIVFYALLILVGVTIAVGNHSEVKLTLFPFPYEIVMPVFIFAMVFFILGLLLGWLLTRIKTLKIARNHKTQTQRVGALENELIAMRSEQRNNLSTPV